MVPAADDPPPGSNPSSTNPSSTGPSSTGPSSFDPFGADSPASELMVRLTLSVLARGAGDRQLWREPLVHRAVLVSGLSLLLAGQRRLLADLEANFEADPGPG